MEKGKNPKEEMQEIETETDKEIGANEENKEEKTEKEQEQDRHLLVKKYAFPVS